MNVNIDVQVVINGKIRAESIQLDVAMKNLDEAKKEILSQCRLSSGEYDKYMLSYLYAKYSSDEESKIETIYMPIVNIQELQRYILQTIKQGKKINFKIEKNTCIDSVLLVTENPGVSSLKRRRMILSSKSRTEKKAKNEI